MPKYFFSRHFETSLIFFLWSNTGNDTDGFLAISVSFSSASCSVTSVLSACGITMRKKAKKICCVIFPVYSFALFFFPFSSSSFPCYCCDTSGWAPSSSPALRIQNFLFLPPVCGPPTPYLCRIFLQHTTHDFAEKIQIPFFRSTRFCRN